VPLPALRGDASRPGIGVSGMRERIRERGGSLEIESDSRGTTVRATLPVKEKAA
jgi:signal transduction histidine kinase